MKVAAAALVLLTGIGAASSCEVPTSCEAAIGLAFLDQPVTTRTRFQRIAYRESRNDPTAQNGQHLGCLQIATDVHASRIRAMGFAISDMLKALPNALVAKSLFMESGWSPWAATA